MTAPAASPGPWVLDRRSKRVFVVCGVLSLLFLLVELGLQDFLLSSAIAFGLLPFTATAVLLLDRVQPEPRAVLAWTFLAGATAVLLFALVLNTGAEYALAAVVGDDTASTLGGSLVAPVVEESGKAAVLVLLVRRFRHLVSGPLDGVVYAAAVGLGFSTVEDVLYYGSASDDGALVETVVVRGLLSPFAHPLFTACTGIGLGLMVSRRTRLGALAPVLGFLLAVALHATWNGSSEVAGGLGFLLLPLVMVPMFVALVVLCRRESRRERGLIRRHLSGEVEAGVLTAADVEALAEVRQRRSLLRAARSAGADGRELVTSALALVE
ncbi:MAG: hypothetical protein JWO60_2035, partial [Frankiales bacterium]|nr:hypothetical protein [Frankiales bacterium]